MTKQNKIEGLEHAPKIMQDFVLQLQDNETVNLVNPIHEKPFWLNKYAKKIINLIEKPYNFIKWFLILSIIVALIVEQVTYYA